MVWRLPEDVERSKRARWRAVAIWVVFLLLVVAALGVQFQARSRNELPLGEPRQAGRLTARLPQGWDPTIINDARRPQLVATTTLDGERADLGVTLHLSQEPYSSPLSYLLATHPDASVIGSPRHLRINSRPAVLVGLQRRLSEVHLTELVLQQDPETYVTVRLLRVGSWSPGDQVIVQQVARTVQVAPGDIDPAAELPAAGGV